jgi:hypothetical protein
MIIGCAAFALPAWVAFYLVTTENDQRVIGDRQRPSQRRHSTV